MTAAELEAANSAGFDVVKPLEPRSSSASLADTEASSDEELDEDVDVPTSPISASGELPPVEISFSASGGAFVYQMGVAAYIQDHFDLSACHFSGCSGGSWAATLLAAETSVHKAWQTIRETQARLVKRPHWYSGYGQYSTIIAETIKALWRDDPAVFKRVTGKNLSIAVTKFPSMTPEKHTSWESLDDLTKSILASCLIPFALTGKPCISHRGAWYVDGCLTNFKGVKSDGYSTLRDLTYHGVQLALDCVRSTSSTVAQSLLPNALAKYVVYGISKAVPSLPAPREEAIAQPSDAPRIIIKPWTWRLQRLSAYHLSVDVSVHQRRFDEGYGDALAHHAELAARLPRKQPASDRSL